MKSARLKFILLPHALWCVMLMSCSSAPTHLYTLRVMPGPALASYQGAPIRVNAVHLPPLLDRTELIRAVGPQEYRIEDRSHWAVPLGQGVEEVLSADLLERLPRDRVLFPHLAMPPNSLGVTIDILQFDSGSDGASLEAGWVIGIPDGPLLPLRASHRWHIDSASGDSGGTAQVLSTLLGKLADEIVVSLNGLQEH